MLTDADCRNAKCPEGKARERYADAGGLYLEVAPNGSKRWFVKYRFGGKERRLALGSYPDVTLKAARDGREKARETRKGGADPVQKRMADRLATKASATTFVAVAREWMTTIHEAKVSAGHAERTRIRFEQDAFPWIGIRPIAEIEAPELLAVLRRVIARDAIETAHRLKDACGQVFRFGIATGACTRNPAADLRDALPPVPTRHHAAIVEPAKAAELLRAMGDYAGHPITRAALALSALLFLRPGELRQLEWAWVDLDEATLTIPAALMKRSKADKANGGAHLVALAPQAVVILRELHPLTGAGRYVFPSLQSKDRPMSENTVNVALRRMGFDRETATAHGFRAMARTMAAERLGIDPQVIEAQLAHAVPDALGRAYNRTTFAEQRRELMVKWADYLDRLRDGAQVIELRGRAA